MSVLLFLIAASLGSIELIACELEKQYIEFEYILVSLHSCKAINIVLRADIVVTSRTALRVS